MHAQRRKADLQALLTFHKPRLGNDRSPATAIAPYLPFNSVSMGDVRSPFKPDNQFTFLDRLARNVERNEIAHTFRNFKVACEQNISSVNALAVLIHATPIPILIPRT